MRNKLSFLGVLAFSVSPLFAQTQDVGHLPVTLGLKIGVPVTQMFSSGTSSNASILSGTNLIEYFTASAVSVPSSYSSSAPRYEFGVSAEFHLPLHLRFEVDGLYKRGNYSQGTSTGSGLPVYAQTKFNQWEIPGLFKYNISLGHFRPFIDFGASYRHISTIDQQTYVSSNAPVFSDNARELRNRNSFGGVAGLGITFKEGPFELTPEARYTRWANDSFLAPGLVSNKDQGDVLLGISF